MYIECGERERQTGRGEKKQRQNLCGRSSYERVRERRKQAAVGERRGKKHSREAWSGGLCRSECCVDCCCLVLPVVMHATFFSSPLIALPHCSAPCLLALSRSPTTSPRTRIRDKQAHSKPGLHLGLEESRLLYDRLFFYCCSALPY